jgi:predicted transporter
MSVLQIVMLSVIGGLLYVGIGLYVGARLAAFHIKRNRKRGRVVMAEDQQAGVIFGGLIWLAGAAYLIGHALTDKFSTEDPGKKCLLCGTNNSSDSAHCRHCGNLIDGRAEV